jgi:hypothetical protein
MHTLSAGAFGLHQAYRCEVSTERRQLPIEAANILTNAPISHEAEDSIIEGTGRPRTFHCQIEVVDHPAHGKDHGIEPISLRVCQVDF